jgi:hypothetical protein
MTYTFLLLRSICRFLIDSEEKECQPITFILLVYSKSMMASSANGIITYANFKQAYA